MKPIRSTNSDFDSWLDSIDIDYELTIEQVMLMNKAWDAAVAMRRHQEPQPPCDNAHVAPGCERFPE